MLSVCDLWDFFSWVFAFSWSRQVVNFTYFSSKKHENRKVFIMKVCGCIKILYTNFPQTNQTKQQQPPSKKTQKPKQNCQKNLIPSNNNKKATHTTCALIEASCGLWWKEYLVLSVPVCGKWQCCAELSLGKIKGFCLWGVLIMKTVSLRGNFAPLNLRFIMLTFFSLQAVRWDSLFFFAISQCFV